ncbi:hypothetical protein TNIN_95091 [Trichonephila inaurata madagascariensis]|uniref:C2H2-type domain-containing protein n=1 Tax=Trichonephila inaurata madagascariensis TaxID=2747483 RepID=A0A8X6YMA9_9ARAC|nr:hypothetical protein TNIN_95091 [Trichonephila inaurata madagascariensis]
MSSGRQDSTKGLKNSPYLSCVHPRLSRAQIFASSSSYNSGRSVLERPVAEFLITIDRTASMDEEIRGTASMDEKIRVCCNECCRDFPSNNLLEIHRSKHHYIRQCPNCNKTFQHTKKYLKHLRSHLNDNPYECKICLECFNKKGDMINHRKEHANLEKRVCRACALKCVDHSHLTRHSTTHRPPYKCSKCNSRFSRAVDRNIHTENHILRCGFCNIPMKFPHDLFYHINEDHRTNKKGGPAPVLVGPRFEYPDIATIGDCDSSDSMAETSSSDDESDTAESSSLDEKSDIAESSSSDEKSDIAESSSLDEKSDIAESSSLVEKSDIAESSFDENLT